MREKKTVRERKEREGETKERKRSWKRWKCVCAREKARERERVLPVGCIHFFEQAEVFGRFCAEAVFAIRSVTKETTDAGNYPCCSLCRQAFSEKDCCEKGRESEEKGERGREVVEE